jgi:hypothetical protein
METIDTGIADARQAVMAMRAGSTDAPLLEVVQRYVEDFADRFAIDADFEATGAAPELPARTQAELLRIVQEALNNVRKHADATVVRVRATSENGTFRLVVTDNGRGFEPGRAGNGFGLAGMRERADLIGAELEIESRPRDGRAYRSRCPSWEASVMQPLRVMLVDDHALVRSAVRGALEAPDIEVVAESASAEDAVRRGPAHPPDVILLDVDMPGMTGLQLVRELHPRLPDTQIVMLSVSGDDRWWSRPCATGRPAT